jgi:Zn-dependent protease/CBS domain-containing protein
MFGNAFTLFRVFGFEVRANVSWLFLAILVTWSLAAGFFPTVYPDLRLVTYWLLGLAGMVGLFFSLLFHELSHSLVARSRGLPMTGITLFLFGGVAEMAMEPRDAKTEFWIAIAGPIASVVLAGFFYIVAVAMAAAGFPEHITGVPQYLGFINLLLAAFNMLPGFPLDGGRVLRAALWHWSGNLTWATRWASRLGQVFGLLLVALGVLSAFAGNFVGGIWWLLIGLFLQGAATAAYQRLLQENALKGQTVRRLMSDDPTTVPADISVAAFVEDYLYPHGHDLFPVVSDHRLVGCVTVRDLKRVPRERWDTTAVGDIVDGCSAENTIAADIDAAEALATMQKGGRGRLMVTDGNRLVGVLALKDLLWRLALKAELDGTDRRTGRGL